MFVHESPPTERQEAQEKLTKMFQNKLGGPSFFTKSAAWINYVSVAGPILSFLKKWFKIALGILGFVFLFKIGGELSWKNVNNIL